MMRYAIISDIHGNIEALQAVMSGRDYPIPIFLAERLEKGR
jgi:hypothetical protein